MPGSDNCLQQQQLGGSIPKPAQNLEAVGHDSKGTGKNRRNGEVLGSNVQVGGSVGDIIWHRELGGDQRDAQDPDGVPSSSGATNHGDDGEARGRRRVGVPSGS